MAKSANVVHAGTVGLVTGQQTGGSHVGRMFGIHFYIGHGGYDSGENNIPLLGRIFVDAYFD